MFGLHSQLRKRGYISDVTKGREVRKHFVIEKITWQLIFYNIISYYGTKVLWVESL